MRLFFHLTNGRDLIPDEDGIEVADVEKARQEARETVEELHDEFDRRDWTGWYLEVTDASGTVLIRISLACH
jgi:Domain of unknown function (DUF6894)